MAKTPEAYLFARIVHDAYGVKKPKFAGQKPKYKSYKAGVTVTGYEFNASDIPSQHIPAFITKDGYIISLNNLFILGEQQEAVIVEEKPAMSDELKNKMRRFSMLEGSVAGGQQRKSKYAVKGALFTGAAFYLWAMAKGKPRKSAAILGLLVGGFAGKIWADYRNRNEI